MAKRSTIDTGNCGEFFVASFLAGMGAKLKIQRINAPVKDLDVTIGRRTVTVQVKAGREFTNEERKRNPDDSYWVWRVGRKCKAVRDDRHWYAFVYLGEWPSRDDPPTLFFLPSSFVADLLCQRKGHEQDYFYMWKREAEAFCGVAGFRRMKRELAKR